jgi:CheY-like chemotaxis protein
LQTILIVDDAPQIVYIFERYFRQRGYHCLVAEDPQVALELGRNIAVSLLLTDYRMPGMNGDELVRAIRGIYPALPVIVLSAYAAEIGTLADERTRIMPKPVELDELGRAVHDLIGAAV